MKDCSCKREIWLDVIKVLAVCMIIIKKRFLSIYPLLWIVYICVYMYYFIKNRGGDINSWKIVLTIIGMDGYTLYKIPNYYLIGEWFLGCVILIYFLFPFIRILYKKNAWITFGSYVLFYIFLVKFYPFQMDISRSILIRLVDFMFGMLFVEKIKKINSVHTIFAVLVLGICIYSNVRNMYILTVAGCALFLCLNFFMTKIKNVQIKKCITWVSSYSYGVFLIQHVVINELGEIFSGKAYSIWEGFMLIALNFTIIFVLAYI